MGGNIIYTSQHSFLTKDLIQDTPASFSTEKSDSIRENHTSNNSTTTDTIRGMLHQWAHQGSAESVHQIELFMLRESDVELLEYAGLAYEEALDNYYSPKTEEEKRQFILAKMVIEKESAISEHQELIDNTEDHIEELIIEKDVHERVLKHADIAKQECWGLFFSKDAVDKLKNELRDIENAMSYDAAWIQQAKKMISLEKYENIPEDVFDHICQKTDGLEYI